MAQVSVAMMYRQLCRLEKDWKKKEEEYDTKIAEMERIVDLLVEKQGALANRPKMPIPPFPDALRRIGLHPPQGK